MVARNTGSNYLRLIFGTGHIYMHHALWAIAAVLRQVTLQRNKVNSMI